MSSFWASRSIGNIGLKTALPLYMQISKDDCILHLSEHHGDCCPGAAMRIETSRQNLIFWKGENKNPYLRTFVSFAMEKRSVLSRKTECLVLSKEKGVEPDC